MADRFPDSPSFVYNESSTDFYRSTLESTSPFSTTAKSGLTPLRKHHKLLKDGSGLRAYTQPRLVRKITRLKFQTLLISCTMRLNAPGNKLRLIYKCSRICGGQRGTMPVIAFEDFSLVTQPSNSENTASRRPSSHSVSSTSSGSSKLSFATASPQVWSRTMTSPNSTLGSSVNSIPSGVREPYEAHSRALQSPDVQSGGFRTVAGDGFSISTAMELPSGMIPLTVNLEKLLGSGVVSLHLQLDVPDFQAVSSSFEAKTIQPGFTARLEAVCPVGRHTSAISCKCITYVWGPTSSHADCSFQVGDPMAYKKEPIFYESSMLRRKLPSMMQGSTHTEPHQPLVCLSKEEAEIQADILQSEQEISTTAYGQVTIFNFPESVLPTCRLFEQGAMMIQQEICFAEQTILCTTYNLNRHASQMMNWLCCIVHEVQQ
ncbi:hypothetical protein C8R42DRAFT_645726 [Lentinula raphanica]|nr:hypothetical protein C8R42DRAFT_645726 [Lentinula raphanica]